MKGPPKKTCAICIELREQAGGQYEPFGKNDAPVWVCYVCRTEPPNTRLGPERGFTPNGGNLTVGQAKRGARRVLGVGPLGHGKANQAAWMATMLTKSLSAGHLLVRVNRLDEDGKSRDGRKALMTLRDEPWFHQLDPLGADSHYFLFQRPDPDARVKPDEPDAIQQLTDLAAKDQ